MSDKESIETLQQKLSDLNKDVELRKLALAKKRMEYVREESDLIYSRECARKIAEEIEQRLAANDIASSLDFSRDREVERYKVGKDAAFEKIKDEPVIPYRNISDLK